MGFKTHSESEKQDLNILINNPSKSGINSCLNTLQTAFGESVKCLFRINRMSGT